MAIHGMNHFNVLTDRLEESRTFYTSVLGFTEGPRPPLSFGGAWMYAGGEPILHISEAKLPTDPAGVLDHLAFTASDLMGTVARLKAHGIEYTLRQQVGTRIWQIFCDDPCGAKVELDFAPDEEAPADAPRAR
jgi:catechol 2,3-dioxygenase-like lactoylglutathione lyase family enzyme